MIVAPLPKKETERLVILRSYGILDTPPEERFDRLTRLVSKRLGVPISLVSLVDADRQWFKSAHGIDATETPRDIAFCAHAILSAETLIVPNALEDHRFADNPLVSESPAIRFYAGTPLTTASGHRLGTLCAIDSKVRVLTPDEEEFLRAMAAIAVDEMELSAAIHAMSEQSKQLQERNSTLDAFVHSLSHDLAGPIRRIKSFCDLLEVDPTLSVEDSLKIISNSAVTADRLLQDLRTFFLVDRVKEPEECDTRACANAALNLLSEDLSAASAHVRFEGEMPRLQFFSGLLIMLFQNLIGNAIKYRAERELVIEIRSREWDDVWEFSVSDNGMGIAEKYHEKVFDLLTRLHSEAEIPGSGLGLAICKKIVRRGGGEMRLESTMGEGTCVTFSLPKAPTNAFP